MAKAQSKDDSAKPKPAVSPLAALRDIKQGKFAPVYYLEGEEKFFIDAITDAVEVNALTEAERGFNQVVLYGKDVDITLLLNSVRKFPMMAQRNVVIVREFQEMADINKEDKAAHFIAYLKQPTDSTVLVLSYKGKTPMDKRKNVAKALQAYATCVQCDVVKDAQLPEFVTDQLAQYNLNVQADALRLIIENVGNNLQRLAKEIEKLAINCPPDTTVTVDQVYQYVGISREYNIFEFQKALATKDVLKANKILLYFNQHQKELPLEATLSTLYGFYSKVLMAHSVKDKSEQGLMSALKANYYAVKDIATAVRNYPLAKAIQCIHFLREADLRAKGVDNAGFISREEILRELVFKLLH